MNENLRSGLWRRARPTIHLVLFAGIVPAWTTCSANATAPPTQPIESIDVLAQAAYAVLTDVLESDTTTCQIHAAEVLIEFGCSPMVYHWFRQSDEQLDDLPIRRVTVWRALAGAAPSKSARRTWVERIIDVAMTPGAPDRLHAVESLAKLGPAPRSELITSLEAWRLSAEEREVVFIDWALSAGTPPANFGQTASKYLNSKDEITQLRAAYITRWLGAPPPASQELINLANRVRGNDQVAAIVLASAYLLSPALNDARSWRARLERLVEGEDPAAAYHALQGLMPFYTRQDLGRVAPLLHHPDADVRVAAAWTILTVDRNE